MNIDFNPAILMWTTGVQGFDTLPNGGRKPIGQALISAPRQSRHGGFYWLVHPQIAVRLSAEVQPAALCHLLGHTFRQWPGTLKIFFYPGGMVDHNGYEWLEIAIYIIYIYICRYNKGIIRVLLYNKVWYMMIYGYYKTYILMLIMSAYMSNSSLITWLKHLRGS